MKRKVAFAFYVVGAVLAVRTLVAGLSAGDIGSWLFGIAFGLAIWWIAVGFGVRLGVDPDDFVASVKSILGFGRPFDTEEPTQEVRTPERS